MKEGHCFTTGRTEEILDVFFSSKMSFCPMKLEVYAYDSWTLLILSTVIRYNQKPPISISVVLYFSLFFLMDPSGVELTSYRNCDNIRKEILSLNKIHKIPEVKRHLLLRIFQKCLHFSTSFPLKLMCKAYETSLPISRNFSFRSRT